MSVCWERGWRSERVGWGSQGENTSRNQERVWGAGAGHSGEWMSSLSSSYCTQPEGPWPGASPWGAPGPTCHASSHQTQRAAPHLCELLSPGSQEVQIQILSPFPSLHHLFSSFCCLSLCIQRWRESMLWSWGHGLARTLSIYHAQHCCPLSLETN